jgi:hypothetical protein
MKFHSNNSSRGSLSSWGAYLEVSAFLLIGCFGIYAALHTGISYDEGAEFQTYLINLDALNGLLQGSFDGYESLTQYRDRYYGIGFHIFSYGLGAVFYQLFPSLLPFSELGSRLIWGHLGSILIFLASGIVFRACILSLTKDRLIAALGMFTFLLWPYVFGHALMNVKDIPFMFGWLSCTYFVLRIFGLPFQLSRPLAIHFVLLGGLTGWLMSIRVSGVLIFVEYFWFVIAWILVNRNARQANLSITKILSVAGIFLLSFAAVLFVFYPILWHQPGELLKAIAYMGSHPWLGDTLTAGEFIEPKTRLIFYIVSWLMVKLPAFLALGLVMTLFLIAQTIIKGKSSPRFLALLALCLSIVTIIFLLIIRRVSLYNELRQVLFIAPLLMLIAIVGWSEISRGFTIFLLAATSIFMVIDDFDLHPYQYTYINEIARHTELGKKYESDYYGLAVKETALWLNSSQVEGKSQCLYVPAKHLWEFAIDPQKFPCLSGFPGDLSLINKPFLFFVQARSVTNFRAPSRCRLIHAEERSLPFSVTKIRMGELYACIP